MGVILPIIRISLLLLYLFDLPEAIFSEVRYPDRGRNVIPVIREKHGRPQPYNDGTVMANVIGSAGMNFLYYFHLLGVSCENTDPEFYRIIQKDFEFCLNKTGPVPAQLRKQPLGNIPKPCVDWKIHRPCYKNLADDYDECLVNKPGLVKKGTDALRFTHAYAKFICGNIPDTEAHLLDRYTKHDLVVDGVFQCFPHLQDRILNCVKRDKVSKTLCSKFFIVHACFGKYYNDDNCPDVQPIYYMDDLFRNMSTSLSCPGHHWPPTDPSYPPTPYPQPYPELPGGWSSTSPDYSSHRPPISSHRPPVDGRYDVPFPTNTHRPPMGSHRPPGRQEYSEKQNPWPGEKGRPWSIEREREPFIREEVQRYPPQRHHQHHHQNHFNRNRGSYERSRDREQIGFSNFERVRGRDREYDSNQRDRQRGIYSTGREKLVDPHANRPTPDTNWNHRPWVDVLDRGGTGVNVPWNQRRYGTETSTPRDQGRDRFVTSTRGPQYASRGRESSSGERGRYVTVVNENQRFYPSTPTRNSGGVVREHVTVIPPARYAVTRARSSSAQKNSHESDYEDSTVNGGGDVVVEEISYVPQSSSSVISNTSSPTGLGFNFYGFEK